jgi:hypothetical protein
MVTEANEGREEKRMPTGIGGKEDGLIIRGRRWNEARRREKLYEGGKCAGIINFISRKTLHMYY